MPENLQKRPGRLRAAWLVLMGQRVTPQQIQAEWADYQRTFDDILARWSASLARQAKARKKELEKLQAAAYGDLDGTISGSPTTAAAVQQHKAALRSKAAQRGLTLRRGGPMPMPSAIPGPPGGDE